MASTTQYRIMAVTANVNDRAQGQHWILHGQEVTTIAAATVLTTYELVELILGELDRASIHRCEEVCRIFRSIIRGSSRIGQQLAGVSPIRRSDLKMLSTSEWAHVTSIVEANGTAANGFGAQVARNWHMLEAGLSFGSRHHFFNYQLVDGQEFDIIPHYARPFKFEINPRLRPQSLRPEKPYVEGPPEPYICDVRGTTIELHLPKMQNIERYGRALIGSPLHYATDPPITTVHMALRAHNREYMQCSVRNPTGIRMGDLVNTYKDMVRTLRDYGGSCCMFGHTDRCVAVFVHDTLPARLRETNLRDIWYRDRFPCSSSIVS